MTPLRMAIIGAGGRVGAFLMEEFAQKPEIEAVGICRNRVIAAPLQMAGGEVRLGSVTEPGAAQQLLGDCDIVVNCAMPESGQGQSRLENRALVEALFAVERVRCIVQFSSIAVYSTRYGKPDSFENPHPNSTNVKLELEQYFRKKAQEHKARALLLRLGHVFGPKQWVSHMIAQKVADRTQTLPFDGRLPSNAIHVRNVAAAIRHIVFEGVASATLNVVNSPALSWRELCDWHTEAMGVAPIVAMSEAESLRQVAYHERNTWKSSNKRLVGEIGDWARSLPRQLLGSEAAKDVAQRIMGMFPSERLDHKIKSRYTMMQTQAAADDQASLAEPRFFSCGVPGPALSYQGRSLDELSDELLAWYYQATQPDAIEIRR